MTTDSKRTKTSWNFQPKIWKEVCGWKGQSEEKLDIEIMNADCEFDDAMLNTESYRTKFEKIDVEIGTLQNKTVCWREYSEGSN